MEDKQIALELVKLMLSLDDSVLTAEQIAKAYNDILKEISMKR